MKNNIKYTFEHSENGDLNLCVEKDKNGKTLSFYKLFDSSLIRFDGYTQEVTYTKFKEECIMTQRFESGESWINITDKNYNVIQYDISKKEKELKVKNNHIISFILDKSVLSNIINITKNHKHTYL